MSFWNEYEEISGNFIGAEEKAVLMDNGIPMKVLEVKEDEANQYGPRYVITVMVPNPTSGEEEERLISFPIGSGVESRERMLAQMKEYMEREDAEPISIKLEKVGRAILIRQA